ncbi:DSBA family oxidoreductase, putative [Talaromyces stipitatus ATCC 10500]|uniref:Glutathione S-transferase kappa n=1 Tax=Talaromyces stipitatus (strain ATCC 10500 / CBS 375.48 / QM 6759 / NRRL 1006) TaxID=441959 RepID=B8ME30_TALSN|nr:DSBA family oxidoreductase, putative [Talaromyces stipitatus ATCC 10500]EED16107.1 DSBA family oxidoreductase, putative [Talaromyces stipitatus ATCC 10500]
MGGIIHAYYDCVSPYSYFAFVHLQRVRDKLASYGVTVESHPIFLGGIMDRSGNTPPWKVPAKAKLGQLELARGIKYWNVEPFTQPDFFPILTIFPQRALTYIKHTYPLTQFEKILDLYWQWFFYQHLNISKPDVLRQLLVSPAAGFSVEQADEIVTAAMDKKWKDALTAKTQEAIDRGAYGAPFFWVVKSEGGKVLGEEPFFGSDRFHQIWDFLELQWEDFKLLPRIEAKL